MKWNEIRKTYPQQWLIIEALEAHTTTEHLRRLDRISVIERCESGQSAFERYRQLHKQYPYREFYYIHTSRKQPIIHELQGMGIRRIHAAGIEG